MVHSHWSKIIIAGLSLVESFRVLKYFQCDVMLALLCHIEPPRAYVQRPNGLQNNFTGEKNSIKLAFSECPIVEYHSLYHVVLESRRFRKYSAMFLFNANLLLKFSE